MTEQVPHSPSRPSVGEYLGIGAIIALGVALNVAAVKGNSGPAADVREIVSPVLAMFALTALVWLLMVLFRNWAVMFGAASVVYYRRLEGEAPPEWIERPAMIFNNHMQVPVLFYVVALFMIAFRCVDSAQVALAWIFVAFRLLHATIYITVNYVPFRFATYAASCITLAVIWARFALSY